VKYVDGYVIVVPEKNLEEYKKLAEMGAKVWKKHGALEYYECYGEDLKPKNAAFTFPEMTRAGPGETIVFSFIIYESRAHRDQVNAKVMADPVMNSPENVPMPFDVKRMAYGGFSVMVES